MSRLIVTFLAVYLPLWLPVLAHADAVATIVKDPFSYSWRQYVLTLGVAMLGGAVSWYGRVRKGDVTGWSLRELIGEMATSAFAGLLAFWACEYMDLKPLLTAGIVGIVGHLGTRALTIAERLLQRHVERRTGETRPADLDER